MVITIIILYGLYVALSVLGLVQAWRALHD